MINVYVTRGINGLKVRNPVSVQDAVTLCNMLIQEGFKSYRFTKPSPYDSSDNVYREGDINSLSDSDLEFCCSRGCDISVYRN